MSYQVTDQDGITQLMPGHAQMVKVVHAMHADKRDVFGDVVLTHSCGYSIALHPNGSAVLESCSSQEARILTGLSSEDQLTLWIQLAAGNVQALLKLDWDPL